MSCKKCTDNPETTYLRVDSANVELRGCPKHLKLLINTYRDAMTVKPVDMAEFSDMVRGYYHAGIESEDNIERAKGMALLAGALLRGLGQEI